MSRPRIEWTEHHCADGVRRWSVREWDEEKGWYEHPVLVTYGERLELVRRLRGEVKP